MMNNIFIDVIRLVTRLNFLALFLLLSSSITYAAVPMGSEFDSTMSPRAGGMMGISSAYMMDPVAAIFSNPATLTQQQGSNAFEVGMTYGRLDLRATSNGVNALGAGAIDGDSELRDIVLPHFAATQRFSPKLVGAMGITGISGLGSDFRNTPGIPGNGITSDLKLFGGTFTGAYEATDNLSIGASLILGIGMFQAGLFSNTASTNAFGIGGQAGVTYDAGPIIFGASWRSELFLNFEEVVESSPGVLNSLDLEQPQQTVVGISTSEEFLPKTRFAFEWRWKNYDDALLYQDFWQDQHSFSVGAEQDVGPVQLRVGYRYATEIAKPDNEIGTTLGGLGTLNIPGAGATPVSVTLINLFQSSAANGDWQHAVSAGAGMQLLESMRADMYLAYSFDAEARHGIFQSNQEFFHLGMGFTWNF